MQEPTTVKVQLYDSFKQDISLYKLLRQHSFRKNTELWFSKFHLKKYLGEGACATVLKAINKQTQRIVALKIIDLEAIDKKFANQQFSKKIRIYLSTEESNLRKCKSAHVIKIYESYENKVSKVFVMEYCNSETLEHFLRRKGRLKEDRAVIALKQIIFGVAQMHRNGIIHRDLKPANILIHQGTYKLADLGFSKELSLDQEKQEHTVVGTRTTMAPQVLNKEAYSYKADIWSVGIIFFLLLFFDRECSLAENYKKADFFLHLKKTGKLALFPNEGVSIECLDFLRKMLEVDQEKRLNWEEALQHSLFIRKDKKLLFKITNQKPIKVDPLTESDTTKNQSQYVKAVSQIGRERITKDTQVLLTVPDTKQLTLLNKTYFQFCKVQLILSSIETLLEGYIDKENTKHIQMLFLILDRCFRCISQGKRMITETYSQEICADMKQNVDFLQRKIRIKRQFMPVLLNKSQKELECILDEKLKQYISSKKIKEKKVSQKINQNNIGLKLQDELSFIEDNYISVVVKELKSTQTQKKRKTIAILKSYRKLHLLQEQQLKGVNLDEWMEKNIVN